MRFQDKDFSSVRSLHDHHVEMSKNIQMKVLHRDEILSSHEQFFVFCSSEKL
jgi:hypothetical protein